MICKGDFLALDDMHHSSSGDDMPRPSAWINKKCTSLSGVHLLLVEEDGFEQLIPPHLFGGHPHAP